MVRLHVKNIVAANSLSNVAAVDVGVKYLYNIMLLFIVRYVGLW